MMHSIVGLAALNALFLAVGMSIVAALRSFATRADVLRSVGVAYLAGVATLTLIATELVVAGSSPGIAITALIGVAIAVTGFAIARRRRHRLPLRGASAEVDEPFLWPALACATATLIVLESLARVAHLQGEVGGDSVGIWTPRAKIIYFHGLDAGLWDLLGGQTYPIFIPTLQALDFHFMGAVDTITLHVQYWLLLLGFVFAVAGLLRPRVPLVLLWPSLLLLVVMPNFDYWALVPQADLPLQYLFVCAAICAWRWIEDGQPVDLALLGIFAAASMAMKREGQLLVACLGLVLLLATIADARRAWPRVGAVVAAAVAVNLPWRIWFTRQGFSGETPGATLGELLDNVDRLPPSLWLVLRLTFGWHDWLLAAPFGLAALAIAFVWGATRLALFFTGLCAAIVVGFTWILWSIDALPIEPTDVTPMPRAVGALVLLALAFAPLLLASSITGRRAR